MKLKSELPHFRATCRDGTSWMLPLDLKKDFEGAWTQGKPFWWGETVYGSPCIVKLADITGVTIRTEESIQALADDDAEELRRKKHADMMGND